MSRPKIHILEVFCIHISGRVKIGANGLGMVRVPKGMHYTCCWQ